MFPGITPETAAQTADACNFYREHYDLVVNRVVAARGAKEFLGRKPSVCRFCGETIPKVTFHKEAHAVPELVGNGTLLSLYECDDCNSRFSAFEDDLGKFTLATRIASQVTGKGGVPSAKTRFKKSRIDLDLTGFNIASHVDDPIAEIDHETNTLTVTIAPQPFRPLGMFKALMKAAVTLMNEGDVDKVPEALNWLRASDVTTDQAADVAGYACMHTFTPGPAPFALTSVLLLRRKRAQMLGPSYIFVLAFGNSSYQISVPAPSEDRHVYGVTFAFRTVPVFGFMDADRVRGATQFGAFNLSSPTPVKAPSSFSLHYDSATLK